MPELTRIDLSLSHDQAMRAAFAALDSFLAFGSLLKTVIAYYGSCDGQRLLYEKIGVDEEADGRREEPDAIDEQYDRKVCQFLGVEYPLTISHCVILNMDRPEWISHCIKMNGFEDESEDKDYRPFLTFQPNEGIPLEPVDIPGPLASTFSFIIGKSRSDFTIVSSTEINRPYDFRKILIKPKGYLSALNFFRNLTDYRLIAFQPILAAYGLQCIALPGIWSDNLLWVPDSTTIRLKTDASEHSTLPPFYDLDRHVDSYIASVYFRWEMIVDEITRRRGVGEQKAQRLHTQPKHIHPRWSRVMSKKDACRLIGWDSVFTLNSHVKTSPTSIMPIGSSRQQWRFDCNDPAFASLPPDPNCPEF